MAVQDYKTNYTAAPGDKSAIEGRGVRGHHFQSTVSILAADDDTSTYLILKHVPSDAILAKLEIERDAITGGSDYDIGFYDPDTGAAVDKDVCMDGGDFSATATTKVAPMDGLVALTHAAGLKPIWEILGKTLATRKGTYDLVLTCNTVGTGAGSVTFRGMLIPAG